MSALDTVTVLFIPGLRDYVKNHWQTLTALSLSRSVTVEPLRVDGLSCKARVAAVDAALSSIQSDVIIAAHSAGCLMVAEWAKNPTRRVRAALLVTPADVENALPPGYPTLDALRDNGWVPISRQRLPFPSLVVASRNDPLASFERVVGFSKNWGASLYDAGEVGHLNPIAGFGPWPAARDLLQRLAENTAA